MKVATLARSAQIFVKVSAEIAVDVGHVRNLRLLLSSLCCSSPQGRDRAALKEHSVRVNTAELDFWSILAEDKDCALPRLSLWPFLARSAALSLSPCPPEDQHG